MKTQTNFKLLKVSGEYLKEVLQVKNETNRNLSGAMAYLISIGFSIYLKERELVKDMMTKDLSST